MGRLLLLRHAKSSWAEPGTRDHDRPLNARGREAATALGAHLQVAGLVPDLVLCSSARRTCETLARLGLPDRVAIEVEHDLYGADATTVVERIRTVPPDVDTLMVIGHNPTIHALALGLPGEGEAEHIARLRSKYPTGTLTVLDVPGPWSALGPGAARLEGLVAPRDLGP